MYTEALARTPMDSPFHISLQKLHFPLPLSSHPVHINAGSNNLCYGQVIWAPWQNAEGQMVILTVGKWGEAFSAVTFSIHGISFCGLSMPKGT